MASRNLTEIFILMRNNVLQNKNVYVEQNITDRMALMESSVELQHRGNNGSVHYESRPAPRWVDALEESQYAIARLESKLKKLQELQETHLTRPTMDESTEQETKIELLTQEISRMFNGIHRLIQQIKSQSSDAYTSREKRLVYNVISSLVNNLQQKSIQFRSMESSYLNKIKTRDERTKLYICDDSSLLHDDFPSSTSNALNVWEETDEERINRQFDSARPDLSRTQQQLLMMEEDNTVQAKIRAQEVDHIVKSIVDLNTMFKDFSHMIIHQGTILDRIDYNVERTEIEVKQGYQQLGKAERYHRKNRKIKFILCLGVTSVILLILLILVKF